MNRRPLPSQQELQELFDYREGNLIRKKTTAPNARKGDVAGYVSNGRLVVSVSKTHYFVHRLIWKWHYGTEPEVIDHINRNPLDNRIENLREANHQLNAANRTTKGYFKRADCSTYVARLYVEGKVIHLGSFKTEAEAKAARQKAHAEHFTHFSPHYKNA
jgi:hypothetical protein